MLCENEDDLLLHWFVDIGNSNEMYKEPILDSDTVRFFKGICDAFELNTHVFVLSIEVAEDYLRAKNAAKEAISDPLLAAVTTVFICHKCEGALEMLKMKHVVDLLFYYTQKLYETKQVAEMEGDILVTLKGQVPITTPLDDLDIIIEKYIRGSRLRANLRPLCLKILMVVYMERLTWFEELKCIYKQNKDCVKVFKSLVSSKFYVPVSILITALQLTNYRHILDINTVLSDITSYTKIHADHLTILSAKIMEFVQ